MTPDVSCTYPAGTFGELDGNLTGLLATEKGDTTPFALEADTAPELYVTGNPANSRDRAQARPRRRRAHGNQPVLGNRTQTITNYLADPTEEAILHMVNADPARTPTLADVRQAGLLPLDGGTDLLGPPACSRTPDSPGTTATTPPRSTITASASSAPTSPTSASTARPRRRRPELRRAQQRPDDGAGQRRQPRHLGRRDRHPADA